MNGQKFCLIVGLKLYVVFRFQWLLLCALLLGRESVCDIITYQHQHTWKLSHCSHSTLVHASLHIHTQSVSLKSWFSSVSCNGWAVLHMKTLNFEVNTHTHPKLYEYKSRNSPNERQNSVSFSHSLAVCERNIHMNVENGLEICSRINVYGSFRACHKIVFHMELKVIATG